MATQLLTPRMLHIFGDESSHKGKHKFLVYGTVSCDRSMVPKIREEIEKAKKGKSLEWHWSESKYPELYPGLVDTIFKCRDNFGLRFRCLVVNTRHTRHKEYSDDDPDLGLEKYIHLHLMTYANDQKAKAQFFVQLDERTPKYRAEAQKRALNAADRRDNLRTYDLFADAIDVRSHTSPLVQVADVLSGAVAYVTNERYLLSDASPKKKALAERIAKLANIPIVGHAKELGVRRGELRSLAFATNPRVTSDFIIWHLHLRAEEEKVLRALSAEQLSRYSPDATYADLQRDGYRIVVECARCDRSISDYLSARPHNGIKLVSSKPTRCGKCGRRGIVHLKASHFHRTRSERNA